ncbi:MAG TPA: hypothetical protein VGL26_11810 [Jatrophihabitans sp.]
MALLIGATGLGFAPSAQAADPAAGSVAVSVISVSPTTPLAEAQMQPLTFTVSLKNLGNVDLTNMTVTATRGDPITTQSVFNTELAAKQPPVPQLPAAVQGPEDAPIVVPTLAIGQSTQVSIPTVSGTVDHAGLCICADAAIYPIVIAAQTTASDGSTVELGATQTYLPAFQNVPAPTQVTWVWPLLERPHRLTSDTVFTDDDLVASISSGGRLDRLLSVAEMVDAQVPMTLLVDPELIDELAVMSTSYQVQTSAGTPVPGTGKMAATAWLTRLQHVLAAPGMELALTPFANPDVDALTADDLTWQTALPPAMQVRVGAALAGHVGNTAVAWPADGVVSAATAQRLAAQGVGTLLLSSSALKTRTSGSPALVSAGATDLTAFSTPATIATLLPGALSVGGPGTSVLPRLVSQLALTSVIDPTTSHDVLMLPPANLDPEPTAAIATILATAKTAWSQPLPLLAARGAYTAQVHATLSDKGAPGLPTKTIEAIRAATSSQPALSSLFTDPATVGNLLGDVPDAVQRLASAQWQTSPSTLDTATGTVAGRIEALTDAIKLVVPTDGSYTLGSNDSPLPITIENTLDKTVQVRLTFQTVGDLPGFTASDIGIQTIPPRGRLPLHVPVHLDRVGRIKVQVVLTAPATTTDGGSQQLGTPLVLSVRSTALGDIGEVIMWGAGGVLALAFVFRLYRRLRRGRGPTPGAPATHPEPEPVGSEL